MRRLTYTPLAEADLLEIALYIADDSPERAESFVAELQARASRLAEFPDASSVRDDISPGLRSVVQGRYLLFFRVYAHEIRIVRILHGARDLPKLL
jgi:toxin ParE1/3/4